MLLAKRSNLLSHLPFFDNHRNFKPWFSLSASNSLRKKISTTNCAIFRCNKQFMELFFIFIASLNSPAKTGPKKKKSFFERGNAQSHQFARGFPSGKKRGVAWVRTRAPWCPRPSANQLSQKKHPPHRSWKKVRVFSPNLVSQTYLIGKCHF